MGPLRALTLEPVTFRVHRHRPYHRLRQSGDAAHRAPRARGGRLLGDRAVQPGRGGHGAPQAQGDRAVGRPRLGDHRRLAARAAKRVRQRPADPFDLLRPADDGGAARRRRRGRACGRVRPRRGRHQGSLRAVRRRLAGRQALSRVDEPRRPRHAAARRLHRQGDERERAVRGGDATRSGASTRPCSTPRWCTRRTAPSCSPTSCTRSPA